jgi:hypothetical protein
MEHHSEAFVALDTAKLRNAVAIAGWQAHASLGVETRLRNAWRDFTKTKVPWSREAEG